MLAFSAIHGTRWIQYLFLFFGRKKKKAREDTSLGQEQVPQVGCRWKTEGPGACDAQAGCDKGCKSRWETNKGCEESEATGISFFTVFLWDHKRHKLLGGARASSAAVSSGVKIVTAQTPWNPKLHLPEKQTGTVLKLRQFIKRLIIF